MKFVRIDINQVSGNSDSLNQCISEFDENRAGNGFLSCDAADQQMINQITMQCEEFIVEHQPHFDWCKMEVLVIEEDEDDE